MANTKAISLERLQYYNPEWTLEMIVIFEKIVHTKQVYGSVIPLSRTSLQKQTHCTRRKVETALQRFMDRGFIEKIPTGVHQINKYKVHAHVIFADFDWIYYFDHVGNDLKPMKIEYYRKNLRNDLNYSKIVEDNRGSVKFRFEKLRKKDNYSVFQITT